jgi:hypothetical protein
MVEKKYRVWDPMDPLGKPYFLHAKNDDEAFEKIAEEWGDESGPDYAFAGTFDFEEVL